MQRMKTKYLRRESLLEAISKTWFAYRGRRENWSQEHEWEQKEWEERVKGWAQSWETAIKQDPEGKRKWSRLKKWSRQEENQGLEKENISQGGNKQREKIKDIKENGYSNAALRSDKCKVTVNIWQVWIRVECRFFSCV